MFGANPPENGLPPNGTSFSLVLLTDPTTNDGNPIDAVVQRQQTEQVASSNTNTFITYRLKPPITLDAGAWFFVGMYRTDGSTSTTIFGPNVDTDGPQAGRSHRVGWYEKAPDISDLSTASFSNSPDAGRNFMIRAGAPAPSAIPAIYPLLLAPE